MNSKRFGILLVAIFVHLLAVQIWGQVVFRDDFNGSALRPEWQVRGEDPSRTTITDGSFLFLTTTDWRGICYTGDLPENYQVTARIKAPPQKGTRSALALLGSSGNEVYLIRFRSLPSDDSLYFGKIQQGKGSEHKRNLFYDIHPVEVTLRISKNGVSYRGYAAHDGGDYSQIGYEVVFLNLKERRICVLGQNDSRRIPELPIRVDYFEIKKTD